MHSSLEAYQALIQKNNKKNGRTLTRSLLTKRIELYQDCNKKQLTFTISTPVMLKISKHFHTEWCRNSLFWSLVTFPNWGKVTGNPASVILENKKKKQHFLFHYWQFQNMYCEYALKSVFQHRRNPNDQILSLSCKMSHPSCSTHRLLAGAGDPFSGYLRP